MNLKINETVVTDAGEYTIVTHIAEGGEADKRIEVVVGRATDGHHDLIVNDNASSWVVGSEDDATLNRDQWAFIAERCGDIDLDAVRKTDEDLADWLEARRAEATIQGELAEPRAITEDERKRLIDANYSADSLDGATVIAEANSAKLYNIGGGYGYAVEGETGEIIADLDYAEALVQWRA